jgi:hypothetical protein
MIHVTIHDHLTHRDLRSEWRPELVGEPLIVRAIQAAWVHSFGSSSGPIEFTAGHWYARGMSVDVRVERPVEKVAEPSLAGFHRPACPSCKRPLPAVAYKHLHRHVQDGSMVPVYKQAVVHASRVEGGRTRAYKRLVYRVEFRLASEVAA